MLAMAGAAYYVAVVGVGRTRCGQHLNTPEIFRWIGRLLDPAPDMGLPFRTPAQAQFWFEWRQKGWGLPAIVIFALPFGFVGWLLFNRNPQALFTGAIAAGALLTVGGLIIGLIFGNVGPAEGKLEMGHFLATRPMTTSDMSRTMLKAAGISVLISWVIWAAAFLALYGILLIADIDPRPQLPVDPGWWYFPVTLLGAWLGLSVIATIGQAGRPMLFGILFCGLPAMSILGILIERYTLSPEASLRVNEGITTLVGVIFIFATAWAFAAARRRSLIGTPTVWTAAGIWGGLCILFVLFWSQHRNEHVASSVPVFVHIVGLLALAVFPLAAGPLALAWNRNR
jgi:hypothetical protein